KNLDEKNNDDAINDKDAGSNSKSNASQCDLEPKSPTKSRRRHKKKSANDGEENSSSSTKKVKPKTSSEESLLPLEDNMSKGSERKRKTYMHGLAEGLESL